MPITADPTEPETATRPPISAKRLAANRNNAQKSTGPRTDAGKAVARRNAGKHYMTGDGIAVPEEFDAEIEREVDIFAARLRPRDEYDWRLVRQAAVGSVRFGRLAHAQEVRLALRRERATLDWDEARADRVEGLAALLDDQPTLAIRQLRRFTEGCDFLWDAWDALKTRLDRAESWDEHDLGRALGLLGWDGPPTASDDGPAAGLTLCALGLRPDREAAGAAASAFFGIEPDQALGLLPTPEESLVGLIGLIEQQMAELRALADRLWDQFDAPDRAAAPDLAWIDPSPEGRQLYRYERDAVRLRDRALRELDARRKESARDCPDDRPSPPPPPRPAAPPPPARNEATSAAPAAGPADSALSPSRNEPTARPSVAAMLASIVSRDDPAPPPGRPEGPPRRAESAG